MLQTRSVRVRNGSLRSSSVVAVSSLIGNTPRFGKAREQHLVQQLVFMAHAHQAGDWRGASFAVLVAEQLFASGSRLLISVTSSGQLIASRPTPYFILIDAALRDEGTSYHYLPPSEFSPAPPRLIDILAGAFKDLSVPVERGATWTTDAPYRETPTAISAMRAKGLLAVEMEAAALYASAKARTKPVICFAHVTNQMARSEGDFEKGEANGAVDALAVITTAASAWCRFR